MSATFKNAKRKLSQAELRRYMQEHKKQGRGTAEVKKIESPLAKYNELGQLTCVLCKSVVRSEAVWTVHINAKQHKENVELAKKLKQRTNNFTTPLKRPLTPPMEVPTKIPKSILKNAPPKPASKEIVSKSEETPENSKKGTVPDDFFDSMGIKNPSKKAKEEVVEAAEASKDETLPEGFFDDPKLDAKARNQEYKDPVEEEWEKFQKEIKNADDKSAAIIAEDQEESTTERQIDEIDEQMKKLSRVLVMEKKKEEIVLTAKEDTIKKEDGSSDDDDNVDFDEFLDWRSKNSFKM